MILCPTNLNDITFRSSHHGMFLSGAIPADVPIIIHAGSTPIADRSRPLSFVVASRCGETTAKHTDGGLNYLDRFTEAKITRPGLCEPGLRIHTSHLQFYQDYRHVLKGTLKTWSLFDVYIYGDAIELHYHENSESAAGREGVVTLRPEPNLPYHPCFGIPGEGPDGDMRYVWLRAEDIEQNGNVERTMRLYTSESSDVSPVVIGRAPNANHASIMYYREPYSMELVSQLLGDGINRVAL